MRALVSRRSTDFETTLGWVAVCAVLFNRSTDDFREERLDDQASIGIIRRYRSKRATLATNERLPLGLVKCGRCAQFFQ